jgi:hypothetical protein
MLHAILTVHGIGNPVPSTLAPLASEIAAMAKLTEVNIKEAFWSDITQRDEDLLRTRIPGADKSVLHSFVIDYLGDAIAYSKVRSAPGRYMQIQDRVREQLRAISEGAGNESVSLMIIAHSLGSVIAADTLRLMEEEGGLPLNISFDYFITLGSPLALYSLRYGIEEFNQPARPKKSWLNFFYSTDPIGYPLRALNAPYSKAVSEDIVLRSHRTRNPITTLLHSIALRIPILSDFTGPFAHDWYTSDKTVIERVGALFAKS